MRFHFKYILTFAQPVFLRPIKTDVKIPYVDDHVFAGQSNFEGDNT
jgi:hypothetical protein